MTSELTPKNFDLAIGKRAPEIIWTLPAIGQAIGTGPDWVRDVLAKMPESPVKKVGGRWCANANELRNFMATRAA